MSLVEFGHKWSMINAQFEALVINDQGSECRVS